VLPENRTWSKARVEEDPERRDDSKRGDGLRGAGETGPDSRRGRTCKDLTHTEMLEDE
jgi:hypothetical protein